MTWMEILRRRLGLERKQGHCCDDECRDEHPVFWDWK